MHGFSSKRRGSLLVAAALGLALVLGGLATASRASTGSHHAIASHTASPLKVALVLDDPPNDQGWGTTWINAAHALQKKFGSRVSVTWQFSIPDPETAQALTSLIQQGYKVIVTTTFGEQQAALQLAAKYPDVTFLSVEAVKTLPNLSTVDVLQADGYYIAGMAAAAIGKGNTNGLVAAFPIPIYLADTNAYELGAQAINPNAKTKLVWSNDWSDATKGQRAALALAHSGVSTLTTYMSGPGPLSPVAKSQNLPWVAIDTDMRRYAPKQYITSVLIDWAPYLTSQVGAILNHTWKSGSYLLTLQNSGVKMAPWGTAYKSVSAANRGKIADALKAITSGKRSVFTGPIKDQSGKVRVPAGKIASVAEVRATNYFVAGVEGTIPK